MRFGVLHKMAPHVTARIGTILAKAEFARAQHLRGYAPAEVHFNPAECPLEDEMCGLRVFADEQVRPGFIRVTTVDLPAADELRAEMDAFDALVHEAAAR